MGDKKKKKSSGNAEHWKGYSEESKRQYEMQFGNKTKRDMGFYGHIKKQTLF